MLDRGLAQYGPETKPARELLRQSYASAVDLIFSGDGRGAAGIDAPERLARVEVLVLWLAIICAGFGLVSARNATVIAALFVCALSVSGAIFLIEEMGRPLQGFMQISSAPSRNALSHLGQ
jgi:hypothetical protein